MNTPRAGGRTVLLVGNYAPDRQESMLRFAGMLASGLRAQGERVETLAPTAWFGRLRPGPGGLGKWLAYLDNYLLFPGRLRRRVRQLGPDGVVHIADHSNAVYVRAAHSAGHPVVVTCHDLGAVRGAMGEDTDCPASRFGRILQGWIVRSLREASALPCVSGATRRDVRRLIRRPDGSTPPAPVLLLGLNVPYGRIDPATSVARLHPLKMEGPFVLNVGSALSRKNRDGVLRIFARTKDQWPAGRLVFAGEALTEAERTLARELGVAELVREVVRPADATLEALYNQALCLLFPSKFEGFGWPAIEAQACGCPVLCSDAGSLGEVVGESAFVRNFRDEEAFAGEILRLAHDEAARARWTEAGARNMERFQAETMVAGYRRLYDELTGTLPTPEEVAAR